MKIHPILTDIVVLIAGALLTLSFAPFSLFPLAIISLVTLLYSWLNVSPARAFWRGWLFGIGLFTSGVYWIFISIHTYGNTSFLVALLLTSAMIAFLALYPALNGYLLNRFFCRNNATKLAFAFPALWVLLEWIRSWFLSGFPWLLVGYSQINSSLKGYAPLFGVYGVSFILVLACGLIVLAGVCFKQKSYKKCLLTLTSFAAIWLVGAGLNFVSWTTTSEKSLQVSLVQGNVPQELKWSPEQVRPTLERYVNLTRPHWTSEIIVWPESAIPLPMHYATDFLDQMAREAGKHNSTIITGIPIKAGTEGYYNGVIALGKGEGLYTKQRLVPFGEYIPFRKWLGHVMDLLQVPMSDFIPGKKGQAPILANGIRIAAFVCYEIAYPEQVLLRDGNVDLILTISNDAWFGESIAQAQHAEMAQMRALEMGKPILFVGNDGITAIINAHGKIQSAAPQHETFVLTDEVFTTQGKTPWQSIAMYPLYFIWVLLLIVALIQRKKSC